MMMKKMMILEQVVFFYYPHDGRIEIWYWCLNGRGSNMYGLEDVACFCGGEARRESEALIS